jgi:hypothetical protein
VEIATTTSINAPAITVGDSGLVTVTVSSASDIPSGNVTLSVDSGAPLSALLDAAGSATFTLPGLTVGDHSLVANYAAQGNFLASNSGAASITVNPLQSCTIGVFGYNSPEVTSVVTRRIRVRGSATEMDYTYTVNFANNGGNAENVQAAVVLAPGAAGLTVIDGDLSFGTIAAGSVGASSDTYTLRWDRQIPFDAANIQFVVSGQGEVCQ